MRGKGYDYWALGHVHATEIVCREPWVVYPGNTQGRHIREMGAKGCTLVTVEDEAISQRFIALDVMRWDTLTLDIDGLPDLEALLDVAKLDLRQRLAGSENRALAARVQVQGSGPLHHQLALQPETVEQQLRGVAVEATNGRAWIEKIEFRTRPLLDLDRIAERDDPIGLLVRELRRLATDETALRAVADEALSELRRKLPAELREDRDALGLDTVDALLELLGEVEADLLARLSGDEGV